MVSGDTRSESPGERRAHIQAVIAGLPRQLEALEACAPRLRSELPPGSKMPAIYLLSDEQGHQYVGRTRDLRRRLADHMNPANDRYSATFAFRRALKEAEDQGMDVDQRRAVIERDPVFQGIFAAQKLRVAAMQVRYLEVPDDIEQAILEVYAAERLATPWNVFRTH